MLETISQAPSEEVTDETSSILPLKDFAIEVCNSCGGLVGWESYREGCCFGGIMCKREKGTRLLYPEELFEELEAPKRLLRGKRRGQLRYYLKTTPYHIETQGFKKAFKRFWAARWYWSCGRIGVVPEGYHQDYWRKDKPNG